MHGRQSFEILILFIARIVQNYQTNYEYIIPNRKEMDQFPGSECFAATML